MIIRIRPLLSLLVAFVITASTFGAIGRSAGIPSGMHRAPIAAQIASHGVPSHGVAMRCALARLLQKA